MTGCVCAGGGSSRTLCIRRSPRTPPCTGRPAAPLEACPGPDGRQGRRCQFERACQLIDGVAHLELGLQRLEELRKQLLDVVLLEGITVLPAEGRREALRLDRPLLRRLQLHEQPLQLRGHTLRQPLLQHYWGAVASQWRARRIIETAGATTAPNESHARRCDRQSGGNLRHKWAA
jgi:hypothetical protein